MGRINYSHNNDINLQSYKLLFLISYLCWSIKKLAYFYNISQEYYQKYVRKLEYACFVAYSTGLICYFILIGYKCFQLINQSKQLCCLFHLLCYFILNFDCCRATKNQNTQLYTTMCKSVEAIDDIEELMLIQRLMKL